MITFAVNWYGPLAQLVRAADGHVGVLFMELVEPGAVHGGIAAVPAEVVVVADGVRDVDIVLIHGAHAENRHGGQTGLVQLVGQIVQDVVVFQQVLVAGAVHGDFVGKAPDRRCRSRK